MKHNRKLAYLFVGLIVLITVGAVVGVYSVVAIKLVEQSTLNTLDELSSHDRNTIVMYLEFNLQNLKRAASRLGRNAAQLMSDKAICDYLSHEAAESAFEKVYVVATDGTYYTDITYRDSQMEDYYNYKSLFDGGKSRVVWLDDLPVMRDDKAIICGYRLEDEYKGIKIGPDGGKEIFAVMGISKRSSIENGLVVDSFVDANGVARGFSSVVDANGNYIVDTNSDASVDGDNWFKNIEEYDSSDLTVAQVKAKMMRRDSFSFYYQHDGVREINYCVPLSDNFDWYFLLSVNNSALAEQTSSYIWMIVISLAITVAIIIAAMVAVVVTQGRAEKALAQERAQSEFLSNMSHEIRTPLNGLVGLNYLMITAIDDPKKKRQVKEWLSKSHSTAKYLLALINDILDVSKLRAGKVEVANEPLLVESIVDAIYSMQCENIKNRGINYVTDVKIDYPCIMSDEVHIKQVIMNIVSNAAKFTPAGGQIKLSVRQDKLDDNRVMTTFVCEDTGRGMSKEFLTKIFDAFTQDRNSNTDSTKGTGLGMAISKMLVNAMGGDITVESEVNKGSKFTVTVPAVISDVPEYLKFSEDELQELGVADVATANGKPLKVLVAEDNDLNAEILIEILSDAGFETAHASDGLQAVKLFQASEEYEYGVILMDMRMPVADGCEASRLIRSLDRPDAKSIPIFACTANTFKEDRVKAFDSGMNDFLTKPIDVKILLQKLDILDKKTDDKE